jgi:hypothetical protein
MLRPTFMTSKKEPHITESMGITLKRPTVSLFVCMLLLCSCATRPPSSGVVPPLPLPTEVTINKDAGRGDHLLVTVRLESGAELPFLVDTGSPMTLLDKSLEPQLGKCLGTVTLSNFGTTYEASRYAAPRLYFGNTPLITDSNAFTSDFVKKMSSGERRPILGILGMDCLRHYCIQLDFQAGKMRFLDPNHLKTARLGQAFPLTFARADGEPPEWIHPCVSRCSLAGGADTNLLLDTGANCDGLLEPQLFRREAQEQRLRMPADTDKEPNNLGLPQRVWSGNTYTSLWVGNGASSTDGENGENALGLRFLARHLVTLDFPHRTMYLKQVRRGPLLDTELAAAVKAARKSAYPLVRKSLKKGQLPGWAQGQRGAIKDVFQFRQEPDTITFDAVKKGDSSTYHYQFTRSSKDGPWQLQKAWRTDQNDHTVQEYPVP